MKKLLATSMFVLLGGAPAALAQVSPVPHTFNPNTVIRSSEVNANFTEIFSKACNRTGCTMTGTATVQSLIPAANNTYDLGSTGSRFAAGWFAGALTTATITVTSTATFNSTVAIGDTSASSLDIGGGLNAGTGNVAVIGADGRIPAIDSTRFASLSGANLTSIPETAITDGSILARVASSEDISGTWALNNNVFLKSKNTGSFSGFLIGTDSSNSINIGSSDADVDAGIGTGMLLRAAGTISLRTAKTTWTTLSSTGTLTHTAAVVLSGTITPSTLANGNNNNYTPTGLSGATYVILTADAGGSTITGLAAQPAGTEITLCEPSPGAGSLTIAHASGSSTAANQFNLGSGGNITLNKDTSGGVAGPCATFWYYGAASRWLLKSTSTSIP